MSEEKLKDLQRDALDHPADDESFIGAYNRPWEKFFENRACRTTSHPNRYICSQCFRNLHVHILPESLLHISVLLAVILYLCFALSLPIMNQVSPFLSLVSYMLVFAGISRWKHRFKAFGLGIVLMIVDQLAYRYIRNIDTDWSSHLSFLLLFFSLFYGHERLALFELSGSSSPSLATKNILIWTICLCFNIFDAALISILIFPRKRESVI